MGDIPKIFDRRLVRWRRDRSFRSGRRPTFLDAAVAAELADRLAGINRSFATIVVHGAGDRSLAAGLRDRLAETRVVETDVVPRAGVGLVFDDEALPFAAGSVDAFVHASGLETVNDVPGALAQIRQALKPDGLFLAALLGGETLKELRSAWLWADSETYSGASPRVAPLVDVAAWGALLGRTGFALPVVDRDRLTVRYAHPLDLMSDLRRLGLANSMFERSRRPVTRGLLAGVVDRYRRTGADLDGRMRAAFEVVYLTGWSPHESQPKPLKPGSARRRLADALQVKEHRLKRD
jgi:SAM-dependent methyltransferase